MNEEKKPTVGVGYKHGGGENDTMSSPSRPIDLSEEKIEAPRMRVHEECWRQGLVTDDLSDRPQTLILNAGIDPPEYIADFDMIGEDPLDIERARLASFAPKMAKWIESREFVYGAGCTGCPATKDHPTHSSTCSWAAIMRLTGVRPSRT